MFLIISFRKKKNYLHEFILCWDAINHNMFIAGSYNLLSGGKKTVARDLLICFSIIIGKQ